MEPGMKLKEWVEKEKEEERKRQSFSSSLPVVRIQAKLLIGYRKLGGRN